MAGKLVDAVRAALVADGRITSRHIHVSASDGRVVLHGTVDSLAGYGIAQEIAESVAGVEAVTNDLQIDAEVDTGPCCRQM